jgi:hypothetical protein
MPHRGVAPWLEANREAIEQRPGAMREPPAVQSFLCPAFVLYGEPLIIYAGRVKKTLPPTSRSHPGGHLERLAQRQCR